MITKQWLIRSEELAFYMCCVSKPSLKRPSIHVLKAGNSIEGWGPFVHHRMAATREWALSFLFAKLNFLQNLI